MAACRHAASVSMPSFCRVKQAAEAASANLFITWQTIIRIIMLLQYQDLRTAAFLVCIRRVSVVEYTARPFSCQPNACEPFGLHEASPRELSFDEGLLEIWQCLVQ